MKPVLLFSALALASSLHAVSAFPGELTFTQNDGEQFQGNLRGDEWLHYVALPNDYVAMYNKESKNYEYALIQNVDGKNILVPSNQKVQEALHLNNPQELAKTIPALDHTKLSSLHKHKHLPQKFTSPQKKDSNKSSYKNKILKTKSSQWKEILKEKNPPE